MKFGINTFLWSSSFDAGQFELLPRIREHGFDGVEIPLMRPREFPARQSGGLWQRMILRVPFVRWCRMGSA